VLLVVANHLWPARFPGGYVGVDVFFVISGYLITSHLRREIGATGRVTLSRFWSRRAMRLLPAAVLVLLFCLCVTAFVLPTSMRVANFRQIGAAGAYFVNWLLAANGTDYFHSEDSATMVRHYWSLSVEEQFYLVWPLLLLAGVLLFRKRGRSPLHGAVRSPLRGVVIVIVVVLVASFCWALYAVRSQPQAAYYETTARAWQFAVGALVAFLPSRSHRGHVRPLAVVSWVCWGALLACAWVLGPQSAVPGWAALLPVGATALLLHVGDIEHIWAPTGATSLRPVQYIGDISYSIYLWHWPLIVAAPFVLKHDLNSATKFVVLAATLVVAGLSKRWVEDPFRLRPFHPFKRPATVLVTAVVTLVVLLTSSWGLAAWVTSSGDEARMAEAPRAEQVLTAALAGRSVSCIGADAVISGRACRDSHRLSNPSTLVGIASTNLCLVQRGTADLDVCDYGAPAGEGVPTVVVTGDSHAEQFWPALDAIAKARGIHLQWITRTSCAVTADDKVGYNNPTWDDSCRTWRDQVIRRIAGDPNVTGVITSSHDRRYVVSGTRTVDPGDGYVTAWQTWIDAGKSVAVIGNPPDRPDRVVDCVTKAVNTVDPCTLKKRPTNDPGPLGSAAKRMNSNRFQYLDLTPIFCDTVCHSIIGGMMVYTQDGHLNSNFVKTLTAELLKLRVLGG
jgi:peptidoglycan/LPS O-acetylase OafA/YrhL